MVVRPSHLLTADQAASFRSVTTKAGALKFETHDKLGAIDKLMRILGLVTEHHGVTLSQAVTLNQVNFKWGQRLRGRTASRICTGKGQADGLGGAGHRRECSRRGAQRDLFWRASVRGQRSAGVWATGDSMVPALALFTTAEMTHGGGGLRQTIAATT